MKPEFFKPFLLALSLSMAVGSSLPGQEPKEAKPASKDTKQAAPALPATKAPKAPAKPAAGHTMNPMLGEQSPTANPASKPPRPVPRSRKKPKKLAYEDRTNLNTASKDELMKLQGVTDAYAVKIIAGRPYRSKAALVVNGVIPSTVYFLIKDKVTAGPVPAKP